MTNMITAGTLAAKADMARKPYTSAEILEWCETCAKRGYYKAGFGGLYEPKRELPAEVRVDLAGRGLVIRDDHDGGFYVLWATPDSKAGA